MSHSASTMYDLAPRRKYVIYLAALAGMFMATLDIQIIATALPTMVAELGRLDLFGWVGAAYLLATAAVTPFYGKLGDIFGRKPVFIFAIALFTVGSLACALAWSMEALIAARVLQGLGGGGLVTSAFSTIADLFEPRERARYQGYSTATFTLSSVIGPVAGGVLSQSIGWEFVFLINIPVGAVVIAALFFAMPPVTKASRPKIDYPGGLLLAASVTLGVLWSQKLLAPGDPDAMSYILPVLIALSLIGFVMVERVASEPVLPLRILTNRTVALSLAISFLASMSTLGMLNYFALFLQTVTGLNPAMVGLMFLPASMFTLVASIGSGILIARTGRYKPYPIASMVLGLVALVIFTTVDNETPVWGVAALMMMFSFGIGLHMQTLMVAVQNAVPHRDVGVTTGSLSLVRLAGGAFGLAINGGLLTAGLVRGQGLVSEEMASRLGLPLSELTPEMISALPEDAAAEAVTRFSYAFHDVYYFGVALFVVALFLAIMLKDIRLPKHEAKEADAPEVGGRAAAVAGE
ncbi:MFS transporter [Hoeflea sp. WL0058]|uniref:MFS transporter n=1 Tax=Flavimaribacter sediminis TaxID=2865987 RepID=A0AAE2ZPV1_9HYPH|nr:MDR family MFS transporter [Flavimaribacter sediminis]MBW8638655.1 MFS transporter [Flavimaribacter sediminis]